jgi:hypothetical protein
LSESAELRGRNVRYGVGFLPFSYDNFLVVALFLRRLLLLFSQIELGVN